METNVFTDEIEYSVENADSGDFQEERRLMPTTRRDASNFTIDHSLFIVIVKENVILLR